MLSDLFRNTQISAKFLVIKKKTNVLIESTRAHNNRELVIEIKLGLL